MISFLGIQNGLGLGSGIYEMQRQLMLLFLDPGMIGLPIKFFCSQGAAWGILILIHIPRPYPNQSVVLYWHKCTLQGYQFHKSSFWTWFKKLVTNINDFTNLFAPENPSKYSCFDPHKMCKIVHYIHFLYFYFGNIITLKMINTYSFLILFTS